jgi:hypothetical protein
VEVMEHPAASSRVLFHYWKNPAIDEIGATADEFLKLLSGPTHIHLTGQDESRCRVVVTLQHGNEPSGFWAIHKVLQDNTVPIVDIHFFIPSVKAARAGPGFFYRMLPNEKDQNRCFKIPFGDSEQDHIAREIMDKLAILQPESVIDVHNTSGISPSFGITTTMDEGHVALVSLFTHRLVVTHLELGSLMDFAEARMPTVTIECGGGQDGESNLMAAEGLIKYLSYDDVLSVEHTDLTLEFFHNPLRLELRKGKDIAYAEQPVAGYELTLLPAIEHFNFGYITPDTLLGFVAGKLEDVLTAKDTKGNEKLTRYFKLIDGELRPRRKQELFMVTTNPEIALKDCLFYLVESDNVDLLRDTDSQP